MEHRSSGQGSLEATVGRHNSMLLSTNLFDQTDRRRGCTRKRCCVTLFIVAAIIQVVLIIGLQLTITAFGRESFEEMDNAEFLQLDCNCEQEALDIVSKYTDVTIVMDLFRNRSSDECPYDQISNSTHEREESFGQDKFVYIFFFIGCILYNIVILLLALWTKNIIDVYFFLLLNVLLVFYSFLQVYQFRSFDDVGLEDIGFIALISAILMLLFTLLFVFFTIEMHTQFGWWIFTWFKVHRNDTDVEQQQKKPKTPTSHLRFYYRYYQITVGLGWLYVLFSMVFFIGEVVLLLNPCDPEWSLTFVLMLVCPLGLLIGYIAVRNENVVLTLLLLFVILLSAVLYMFKFIRFASGSCPRCMLMSVVNILSEMDRDQEIEHLTLFAAINFFTSAILFFMVIIVALNYKKGLGDHFRTKWENKSNKLWKYLDLSFTIPHLFKELFCFWKGSKTTNS